METILTLLKDNALMAVMFLATALYLGGDIQALRTEMAAGFQAIRTEMAADHQEIRAEMAAGHQEIRAEMVAGDQGIRTTMVEEFKAVRSDLSDLRERMARVETRLGSIEDRLYMDTALLPM